MSVDKVIYILYLFAHIYFYINFVIIANDLIFTGTFSYNSAFSCGCTWIIASLLDMIRIIPRHQPRRNLYQLSKGMIMMLIAGNNISCTPFYLIAFCF